MTYGTAACNSFGQCWRQNSIPLQEKQNLRNRRSRRSHFANFNSHLGRHADQNSVYSDVSLSDGVVGGVSKRGVNGRKHKIRFLEESYSLEDRKNPSESEKSVECELENGFCESPRSVCGDQSVTYGKRKIKASQPRAKTRRVCHRHASYYAKRDRVLQALGSDLIAPWLTPGDLYSARVALRCKWSWSQSWHGGRVRNKSLASVVAARWQHGFNIDIFFEKYSKKDIFNILFYILSKKEYLYFIDKYEYIFGLRKLVH